MPCQGYSQSDPVRTVGGEGEAHQTLGVGEPVRAARVPRVTLTCLHSTPLETHGLRRSSREEKHQGQGAGSILSVLTSARELPAAGGVTSASRRSQCSASDAILQPVNMGSRAVMRWPFLRILKSKPG